MAATVTGMADRRCSDVRTADGTRDGAPSETERRRKHEALRTAAKAAAAAVLEQTPAAAAAAQMCTAHTQNVW